MKIMKEKIMKYMFYYIIISRQNQRKTPPACLISAASAPDFPSGNIFLFLQKICKEKSSAGK